MVHTAHGVLKKLNNFDSFKKAVSFETAFFILAYL